MRQLLIVLAVCVCISVEVGVKHVDARKHGKGDGESIKVTSIPPIGLNCTPSPGGKKHGSRMEVVSRFGGCSKFSAHSNFSFVHLLEQDRFRAAFWTARLANTPAGSNGKAGSINMGLQSGHSYGYPGYYVTVGLGTPQKKLSLTFDTGSGVTWLRCKPCGLKKGKGSCYEEVDRIYNPAASSTYSNITCSSDKCRSFTYVNDNPCLVSANSCAYNLSYGDRSFTAGLYAKETLTLTQTDALTGFQFGCAEENAGISDGITGVIGLDMEKSSMVMQASSKYGKYFSYCMPNFFSRDTGHLTLGKGGTASTHMRYTPFIKNYQNPEFYFIGLQSILVAGKKLNISPDVFSNPGTIIDTVTSFTSLPPVAFTALAHAFTTFMDSKNYPSISYSDNLLENFCYNLTGMEASPIPAVSLVFQGGAQMDIHRWGIIYPISRGKMEVCLAFNSNGGGSNLTNIGIVQTVKHDIVYDIDGGRIGFGANGC